MQNNHEAAMEDETIDGWLGEQIESADSTRRESNQLAPNSYGAGYDQGRHDAFIEAFDKLKELWGPGTRIGT